MVPVTMTHAYVYDEAGQYSPGTLKPRLIAPAVRAHLESYHPEGTPWPVRLPVQYSRSSGQYEVTFEATDEDRWEQSHFSDLTLLPAQVKPAFR